MSQKNTNQNNANQNNANQNNANQNNANQNNANQNNANSGEDEGPQYMNVKFYDFNVRQAFIRKVFAIVLAQLMVTAGTVCIFMFSVDAQDFYIDNKHIFWVSLGVFIFTYLLIACVEPIRRTVPVNYIALFIFTTSMALMLSIISFTDYPEHVLIALLTTIGLVFLLTFFAFTTNLDFTGCGVVLMIAVVALILFSILGVIFPSKLMELGIGFAGAIIFSFYIIYDIQKIMGGKKHEIEPEEYIFAALLLYVHIINLFIYILKIVRGLSK